MTTFDYTVMNDDYGYFGSGTEGYIHYTQAQKRGGGGGGGGGSGKGWYILWAVIILLDMIVSCS